MVQFVLVQLILLLQLSVVLVVVLESLELGFESLLGVENDISLVWLSLCNVEVENLVDSLVLHCFGLAQVKLISQEKLSELKQGFLREDDFVMIE